MEVSVESCYTKVFNMSIEQPKRFIFMVILLFMYHLFIYLLDFIHRGSLFSIFTTLIYHKVLINNSTEQDTEQDKQTQILVEQFTCILTQYI